MVLSDSAERFMRRLPVLFSLCLFGSTWVLFVFFVSIKQVLLVRHETWRFVMQIVVFNTLAILSLVSYIVAVSRHPLRPDQTFAPPDARPLLPDEVRPPPSLSGRSRSQSSRPEGRNGDHVDDDDIPLRLLRTARQESNTGSALTHRDHSPARSHHGDEYDDGLDVHESHTLLGKPEQDGDGAPDVDTTPIMAKGATGGPRWCRKCDGWKPDRCHHCRSCMQCVLKMDHHCPWLDNCVGYHNYKPFILFLTYCTSLCVFGAWQTGIEVYRFFKNPVEFEKGPVTNVDEMDELKFALMPVVWMVLTILAFVFGIAVGGMCAYHWFLLLNNRTTLEDMNRSVPTALLDPATRAVLEELGPRGSRNRLPGAWRPDHILTRPERTRLRSEAREINVYDVGWSRNLRSVMCGDGAPPVHTFRALLHEVRRAAWPLARPRTRQYGAGHFFEHDPAALQQLKALTSEMRLGLGEDAPSSRQQQTHHLGEWTIGHSDSDSEDE